jgi:hypothetical protein
LLEVAWCWERDALEALKLELKLELELLKSLKLAFAFTFELKFPFETRVCGYGDGLDEGLDRPRRRGCKSEGNGPYVCTECAKRAGIPEGSSGAWNAKSKPGASARHSLN